MTKEFLFLEQNFPIECYGRNNTGKKVLEIPVDAIVKVYRSAGVSEVISSIVECIHNTGSHGERCKAAHPLADKVGKGATCPYSFDLPYALERDRTTDLE